MTQQPPPPPRNGAETRARILHAAQIAFSEKGYSQAGLRDIAARAGVASSLLVKYYGTKLNLFEKALEEALIEAGGFTQPREQFGDILVRTVLDPSQEITAPAMIALALGDAEAREVTARVIRDRIITPVATWLGGPEAEARAAEMMMLSTALVIYGRYLKLDHVAAPEAEAVRWLTRRLQAVVDGPSA